MTDDLIQPPSPQAEADIVRARQKARAKVMAVLLGAFVILIFAISIVKIQLGHTG